MVAQLRGRRSSTRPGQHPGRDHGRARMGADDRRASGSPRRPAPRCCAGGPQRSWRTADDDPVRAGQRTAPAPGRAEHRGNKSRERHACQADFTQPNPPPSRMAASAASHSALEVVVPPSSLECARASKLSGSASGEEAGHRSRRPPQEVDRAGAMPTVLALLHVELGARRGSPTRHQGRPPVPPVLRGREQLRPAAPRTQRIAVHEIRVVAGLQDRRRGGSGAWSEVEPVPAHLRQPQTNRPAWLGHVAARSSRTPGWSRCSSPRSAISCMPTQMPRNGRAAGSAPSADRVPQARNRGEARRAVGERTLPRQHDRGRPLRPRRRRR